jgi:hypothetical protein
MLKNPMTTNVQIHRMASSGASPARLTPRRIVSTAYPSTTTLHGKNPAEKVRR